MRGFAFGLLNNVLGGWTDGAKFRIWRLGFRVKQFRVTGLESERLIILLPPFCRWYRRYLIIGAAVAAWVFSIHGMRYRVYGTGCRV